MRPEPVNSRLGPEDRLAAPVSTEHGLSTPTVPPALPSWVTADFINETIRVWQPHSKSPLTQEDAIEIIMNMSHLLDVVL